MKIKIFLKDRGPFKWNIYYSYFYS